MKTDRTNSRVNRSPWCQCCLQHGPQVAINVDMVKSEEGFGHQGYDVVMLPLVGLGVLHQSLLVMYVVLRRLWSCLM